MRAADSIGSFGGAVEAKWGRRLGCAPAARSKVSLRPLRQPLLGFPTAVSPQSVAVPLLALFLSTALWSHPLPARAENMSREAVEGLLRAGRYGEAETGARELLRHVEQDQGPESLETGKVLDVLSDALRLGGKGGDSEALALCERAIQIKEKTTGRESPEYAQSMHNLGALYLTNGRYDDSRPLLERALEIRRRALGEGHPDVGRSMLYLALLQFSVGKEEAAEPIIVRAIEILRAALSPEDPDIGRGLNLLASVRYATGDYKAAVELWEEVLALKRKTLGADHPGVAESLQNLAAVYGETGDNDAALQGLYRALEIRRRALGARHPLVGATLCNIASNLENLGDDAGARRKYEEALRIQRQAYPQGHPQEAWTLMHLGRLAIRRGDLHAAEPFLESALAMQRKSLGPEHPDLAWTLNELAVVAERGGDRETARARYRQAIGILQKALGPAHPDLAVTLGHFARFLAASGDEGAALDDALRSALLHVDHLRITMRGLAERQGLAYASIGSEGLDVALMIAARQASTRPEWTRSAWDGLIRSRTVVLDEMASRRRAALGDSARPDVISANQKLTAARQRLANLLVRGVGAEDPEHYRSAIERSREEVEREERELAMTSGVSTGAHGGDNRVGYAEVFRALPARSGLVAYAIYDSSSVRSYIVFIVTAEGILRAIPLGRAGTIDALVRRWSDDILAGGVAPKSGSRRAEGACRTSGAALRKRIWDPVSPSVRGLERVFVVPDGSIHLLNLAALPEGSEGYLIESGPLIHLLSAERDLCAYSREGKVGHGLLALGGPSFDARESTNSEILEASHRVGGTTSRGIGIHAAPGEPSVTRPEPGCNDFRSVRFQPLPEAVHEVAEVATAWGAPSEAVSLTGSRAGEAALKRLAPGRRVLHFATHAFFLDANRCLNGVMSERGIGGLASEGRSRARRRSAYGSPLLLSGLALAGANLRQRAGPGNEDGILMAQEIVSLDLSGVEWVVLSACNTGVGEVQPGEGVLGLRRAFELAGARTVIMSLWEVQDRPAREWMLQLYENRYKRGESTADAVRDAALGMLRDRRAHGRSTHPFYWAEFVAAGDWR